VLMSLVLYCPMLSVYLWMLILCKISSD
jgi:hypothetical protein